MKFFRRSKSDLKTEEDANRAQRNQNTGPAPQTLAPPGVTASPYVNNSNAPPPAYSNNSYGGGNNNSYGGGNNNSYGGGNAGYPSKTGGYNEPNTYGGAPEPTSYGGGGGGGGYDSNRDALFGNKQRQQLMQKPQPTDTYSGAAPTGAGAYAQSGGYNQQQQNQSRREWTSVDNPYDTGDNRQLNAEQEEEEDVDALKQQIRFTKMESVASTENALRAAQQAEETGRNTLRRLGEQGEKLHNTEVNLALAKNHGRIAEAKAKELKTLNRSMFAVHVANPFNSQSRAQQKEQQILSQQQIDREERDKHRSEAFDARQRIGGALDNGRGGPGANPRQKMSLADRAKYQFEGDEEDDEMENRIEDNLNQIGDAASRLKQLALATGQEVDRQNKRIENLSKQSELIDDQIALNTHRLKKFGA